MPRYFFHLHTENSIDPDGVCLEFPSLDAAVADAQRARREYLRDEGIEDPKSADAGSKSRIRTGSS